MINCDLFFYVGPTGKVNLDKPLNLVIGTVSPTSVLLSWGPYAKVAYEGNIMNDCLENGCVTCAYVLTHKLLIWAPGWTNIVVM